MALLLKLPRLFTRRSHHPCRLKLRREGPLPEVYSTTRRCGCALSLLAWGKKFKQLCEARWRCKSNRMPSAFSYRRPRGRRHILPYSAPGAPRPFHHQPCPAVNRWRSSGRTCTSLHWYLRSLCPDSLSSLPWHTCCVANTVSTEFACENHHDYSTFPNDTRPSRRALHLQRSARRAGASNQKPPAGSTILRKLPIYRNSAKLKYNRSREQQSGKLEGSPTPVTAKGTYAHRSRRWSFFRRTTIGKF